LSHSGYEAKHRNFYRENTHAIINLWGKEMLKRIKHILIALVLTSLILGASGCSIFLPWAPTSSPPASSQPSSPSEYTNPDWTFPSGDSQAAAVLPDIAEVVKEVMPLVVSVTTEMTAYDIFSREYTQAAAGSGVIIDSEGYIITNYHVVENAKSLEVELSDGRTFPADIVGTDALTDLAVIKADTAGLPYARLGDSSQLAVGDWVVALGNALGEGISAAEGIVSRLNVSVSVNGNTLRDLIQTTSAINPGNSGGPLVDMSAEVIGITSVKVAEIGIEGMGYAISINSTKPIIEELIHQGYVTRPWLGVSLYTVTPSVALWNELSVDEGALIVEVAENSPAEAAGLQQGDVIIKFQDKQVTNTDDLLQSLLESEIGATVKITFVRGESTKTTSVQLQESPSPWD
jgi:serine protease Do